MQRAFVALNTPVTLTGILATIGTISTVLTLNRVLRFSWPYLRPSSVHRYINPDSYALITGSTGGIGKSIAAVLLSKGSNVIIHGRNPEKLESVRSELQAKFSGRKVLAICASAEDPASSVPTIEKFIKDEGLCVTMLVNNVGGTAMFGLSYTVFGELEPELLGRIITLNAVFPAQLTNSLIPLLGRTSSSVEQRPSLIMSIGSFADLQGIPLVSAYSGAKSLMHTLSKALAWEVELFNRPIEVLSVTSGPVVAQHNSDETVSLSNPSSDTFAAAAVQRVGCGRRTVIGYFWHAVQLALVQSFPERMQGKFVKAALWQRYEAEKKGN
ncbi:NAD(P)-binding protein [Rhizodiscina lignyota]|uniref:NAD(P)-binding protein n=1 Tax=Rhizodiscina lignyota TaxID=1504668 RepID=A0A9P4IBS4_9PEZI|nr:NAD(P)-binding protein [Rhizodiscina lignyota]